MSEKYPDTFDKYYRPRWEYARKMEEEGKRFSFPGLPMLCQTCQIPMVFTEQNDPTMTTYRASEYKDERYNFCSDGCKDIFDDEPEKYVQAWLPVHQIFQGNCGGPDLDDILSKYYNFNLGADNADMKDSGDMQRWKSWKGVA